MFMYCELMGANEKRRYSCIRENCTREYMNTCVHTMLARGNVSSLCTPAVKHAVQNTEQCVLRRWNEAVIGLKFSAVGLQTSAL